MIRRIKISPGFCALVCVLGWYDLRLCGWFLLSLLVHEAGHGAAMLLLGVPVRGITLGIGGAVLPCGLCSYRQELWCAAAGPAAGALLSLLVLRQQPELAILSGGLSIFNLLPLYPLDGGRMLRAALLCRLEEDRVRKLLRSVRFVVCGLLMLAACWVTTVLQSGIWPIFAVLVLLCRAGSGRQENSCFSTRQRLK